MSSDYSIYRYYKGEQIDPFDRETQNAASNFWDYEYIFEDNYNRGDFSPDFWVIPYASDIKEWRDILDKKPVDKEKLFKLWLYRLLMEHLPDKYESGNTSEFLNLYYGNIPLLAN